MLYETIESSNNLVDDDRPSRIPGVR
jgi:hypothetical protein